MKTNPGEKAFGAPGFPLRQHVRARRRFNPFADVAHDLPMVITSEQVRAVLQEVSKRPLRDREPQ